MGLHCPISTKYFCSLTPAQVTTTAYPTQTTSYTTTTASTPVGYTNQGYAYGEATNVAAPSTFKSSLDYVGSQDTNPNNSIYSGNDWAYGANQGYATNQAYGYGQTGYNTTTAYAAPTTTVVNTTAPATYKSSLDYVGSPNVSTGNGYAYGANQAYATNQAYGYGQTGYNTTTDYAAPTSTVVTTTVPATQAYAYNTAPATQSYVTAAPTSTTTVQTTQYNVPQAVASVVATGPAPTAAYGATNYSQTYAPGYTATTTNYAPAQGQVAFNAAQTNIVNQQVVRPAGSVQGQTGWSTTTTTAAPAQVGWTTTTAAPAQTSWSTTTTTGAPAQAGWSTTTAAPAQTSWSTTSVPVQGQAAWSTTTTTTGAPVQGQAGWNAAAPVQGQAGWTNVAQPGFNQQAGRPVGPGPVPAPGPVPPQQGVTVPNPASAPPVKKGTYVAPIPPPTLASSFYNGTLVLKPQAGKFLKNLDFMKNMDPYLVGQVGNEVRKSTVAESQGMTPVWTDTLSFPVNGVNYVNLQAFDKDDLSKDDYIGGTNVSLDEVISKGTTNNWYNVVDESGNPAGQVLVGFQWMPSVQLAGSQYNMPANYTNVQGAPQNLMQQSFGYYAQTHPGYTGQAVIPPGVNPAQVGTSTAYSQVTVPANIGYVQQNVQGSTTAVGPAPAQSWTQTQSTTQYQTQPVAGQFTTTQYQSQPVVGQYTTTQYQTQPATTQSTTVTRTF